MVLDISTKKRRCRLARAEKNKPKSARRSIVFSRLARVIFLSNLIGLTILILGSLALNQYTAELIKARVENLRSQASLITSVMGDTASGYGASAQLDVVRAKDFLDRIELPPGWRVRLHDSGGNLLVDRDSFHDEISVTELDPIDGPSAGQRWYETLWQRARAKTAEAMHNLPWRVYRRDALRRDLRGDISRALAGETVGGERYDRDDDLIVTVSLPVTRVQQVLGAVTLESADVQDIIASERRALTPFIGLAIVAALLSSIALTISIVQPLRQLSRAAEIVGKSSTRRGDIPDFSKRGDEIGDLSVVLRSMTNGLYSRIDDIANFAADVAHEIKNPLTSLRSASDTLRHAKNDEQREKLISIIQEDVGRMDRLISDISRASKVDANLARETAQSVKVDVFLANIAEFYQQTLSGEGPKVVHVPMSASLDNSVGVYIRAFEMPFAQVLRNLIDNALTFSPPFGTVRIYASLDPMKGSDRVVIKVEDDGPGIPADNLETIFERFYTERPKGAQFGSHSGLGLAICRQIVTAHKGDIRAENIATDGNVDGARFIVRVPRVFPKP